MDISPLALEMNVCKYTYKNFEFYFYKNKVLDPYIVYVHLTLNKKLIGCIANT
jgi:hypothetical protein